LWKCGGAPSFWNSMSSGPCSSKISMRNSSMSRYSIVRQRKKAQKMCLGKVQTTFNFELSLVSSVTSWWLLLPPNSLVMSLTFPDKWNVDSSLKTILAVKDRLNVLKGSQSKLCLCLG
jgi:hypothetical protein